MLFRSSAQRIDVPSLLTVLALGMSMHHASMIPMSTRTRDADCTRSLLHLLTMVLPAPTRMRLSSAPTMVALSQWTVLVLGTHMALASMTPRTTRTGGVGCTSTALALLTTVTVARTATTTSNAPPPAAPSLWTVLDLGALTRLALMLELRFQTFLRIC